MSTNSKFTIVKRAIVVLLVAGVVAAGGTWYVMAGRVMNAAQALIDKANTMQHTDGSSVKIAYDGLSRTMFPTIGVRVSNPSIEFNAPGAPAAAVTAEQSAAAPAPQPLHVTWKHTGTVDIITDQLAHEFRVVNDGSGAGTLEAGNDKIAISSAPAHSEMSLKAKNGDAFKQWQAINLSDPNSVKQALAQIGGAHIAAGAVKLTDSATNAVILTQDEASFDMTNRSDDKQINFDVSLLAKGSEVTKEYTNIVVHVMNMLQLPTSAIDGSMPLAADRAGKQDMEIALSVNLPTPNGQPTPNGDVHVSKFSIKNNFYSISLPLDVALHEDAGSRHATIKMNWSLEVTPTGAAESQVLVDQAMQMAPGGKGENQQLLKQKIMAALPTVSTLGPITLVLDVDASVPKPSANGQPPADSKQSVTLRQFSFGHKRWGIDAKGEASSVDASPAGTVTGTLTCKQCTTLTGDLFSTAHDVQEVTAILQPGTAPLPLSDAMLAQLNAALASIGKPGATNGDIDFVVTTPTPGDIRVNDKPVGQVMPQLMMVFMPPPAAAPAPAPARLPQPTPHGRAI